VNLRNLFLIGYVLIWHGFCLNIFNERPKTILKRYRVCGSVKAMSEYFVAGGTHTNLKGEEYFDLVCPAPGEPPYVLADRAMGYFRLLWQNAHLYRVEDDYSLTLVATSPEAQQCGVKAPVSVWPRPNLLKKLQAVIKQGTSPAAPEENEKMDS